jgi:hypothetical protein
VRALNDVDDDELTARFRELELELRRREAEMAAVVAEADRRGLPRADGHRGIGNWMRAHANWSGAQVARRRRLARLVATVPGAAAALEEGRIGVAQADELARVRSNPRCGDRLAEDPELVELFVEQCEHLSFDDARTCLRRWESLADLDGAHRDRAANEERRGAHVIADHDGLTISASGGSSVVACEVESIFGHFVELEFRRDLAVRTAAHGPDAPASLLPRTAAQRRHDAFVTMARAAVANPDHAPAVPLTVNLVADPYTFMSSLADHGLAATPAPDAVPPPTRHRCETAGGAVVAADELVRAALTGHIRRVVTDSAGVVVDAGRKRRLFSGAMRDVARLLARRCQYPGCTVPVRATEIDHLAEWHEDGHTVLGNAGIGCGAHNRRKHRERWHASRTELGTLEWRRADGSRVAPVGRRRLPDHDEVDRRARERLHRLRAEHPPPAPPRRPPPWRGPPERPPPVAVDRSTAPVDETSGGP